MKRILIGTLALVVLAVAAAPFGLAWYTSGTFLRPPWYLADRAEEGLRKRDLTDPQTDFGIAYEEVEFAAIDGSTLRGWFVPAREPADVAVVTVHGGGSDRRSFLWLVPVLHASQYPVLLFDCRAQGVSGGGDLGMGLGMRESADVISALDFLETRGFVRFAALGSSQGATSSILAASIDERIVAVMAAGTGTTLWDMVRSNEQTAPLPDWWVSVFTRMLIWRTGPPWHDIVAEGPNPADVIADIAPRAVLLIQGEHDEMAPALQARENFALAGEPKELWIVPGARHRGLRKAAGPEYDRRVLAFLVRHAAP